MYPRKKTRRWHNAGGGDPAKNRIALRMLGNKISIQMWGCENKQNISLIFQKELSRRTASQGNRQCHRPAPGVAIPDTIMNALQYTPVRTYMVASSRGNLHAQGSELEQTCNCYMACPG